MKADKNELDRLTALYASGQLTAAEREKLYAAALEDQVLFEALAHEDALRDVLAMPGAKARVIEGLKPKRSRWFVWAGGLAAAATTAIVFVFVRTSDVPDKTLTAENHAPQQIQAEAPPAPRITAPASASVAKAKPAAPAQQDKPITDGRAKQVSLSDSAVAVPVKPPEPRQEIMVAENKVVREKMETAPVNGPARAAEVDVPAPAAGGLAPGMGGGVRQPSEAPRAMESPARPTFSAPMSPVMSMMPRPPYTILLKNAAGEFIPASQNQVFQKGDTVRVALVAPLTGRMTVNNSGQISSQIVTAGQRYLTPEGGELVLDKTSGETLIGVTFQVDPTAEFSKKAAPARSASMDALVTPTHIDIKITYK